MLRIAFLFGLCGVFKWVKSLLSTWDHTCWQIKHEIYKLNFTQYSNPALIYLRDYRCIPYIISLGTDKLGHFVIFILGTSFLGS